MRRSVLAGSNEFQAARVLDSSAPDSRREPLLCFLRVGCAGFAVLLVTMAFRALV